MPSGVHPRPLKLREFLEQLKSFGVEVMPYARGKGSEIILIKPNSPGEMTGPQCPIKNHGMGVEVDKAVIGATLRRLGIKAEDFWRK